MKTTDINLEILKNYGLTEINTVFSYVSESDRTSRNISNYLYHDISNSKVIYLCLEDAFLTELDTMIKDNKSNDFRAYILVKKINPDVWNNCQYKDKIIVREIPDLQGNYAIVESEFENTFFFFDKALNGYKGNDTNTIIELKQVFVSEFWNYSQKEFLLEYGNISEKTFDVPLLKSGNSIIVNDGVEEKSSLERLLSTATSLFVESNPEKYINSNLSEIYLKKLPGKEVLNAFLQNGMNVFYCPNMTLHFFKEGDDLYIANIDLSSNSIKEKRDGRFFALKTNVHNIMYGDVFQLNKTLTWNDCEGKKVLDCTGKEISVIRRGQDVSVSARPTDARTIKKYRHDISKWEPLLEKQNIFTTNQNAIEILYKITIPVMKKTFTNKADVYSQFTEANNRMLSIYDECINLLLNKEKDYNKRKEDKNKSYEKEDIVLRNLRLNLSKEEDISEQKIREYENDLKKIETSPEIDSYKKAINTWEGKIQDAKSRLQLLLKDEKKAAGSKEDIDKQIDGYQKEIDRINLEMNQKISELGKKNQTKIDNERNRIKSYREKETNKIDKQQKEVDDIISSRNNLTNELKKIDAAKIIIDENKKKFSEIKSLSDFDTELLRLLTATKGIYQRNIDIKRPDFELPIYGELYQSKQSFEYVIFDEDNLEKAEQEMEMDQILDVKYVVS